MMRYAILLFSLIAISCTHTYERIETRDVLPANKLEKACKIYISIPKDGVYGPHHYHGSGQMTAIAIRNASLRYTNEVVISTNQQPFQKSIAVSKDKGFDYYIHPTILHWEDRRTEWSGRRDRIEVKIAIYNVTTGKELDSVVIKGKSRWATFGGDHPQDLLRQPINEYVSTLFDGKPKD